MMIAPGFAWVELTLAEPISTSLLPGGRSAYRARLYL